VACGARLSNLGKLLIFLRSEIRIVVVPFQDRGYVLALFRAIKGAREYRFEWCNRLVFRKPEHFMETIEPGPFPAHKAGRNKFTWHGGHLG
jgi:hypothetical protein